VGLELEDDLQRPLARFGLVGRVRGRELGPAHDVLHGRRNRVLVDAPAQKTGESHRGSIAVGETAEHAQHFGLGAAALDGQHRPQAVLIRDHVEQRVLGLDSEDVEHGATVVVGVVRVRHRYFLIIAR
jgi:hypothetical protein